MGTAATREDASAYWEQEPVAEFEYGTRHTDGVAADEVTVYDDREASGTVKVQFRHNGPVRKNGQPRRRRVAVFSLDDPAVLADLASDLQVARAALEA